MRTVVIGCGVLVGLLVGGCSATRSAQRQVSGWFGSTPTPVPAVAPTPVRGAAARPYFAAVDKLPVYGRASKNASIVGTVGFGQKVLRYRVEKGFAYVKVAATGVTGWVDNGKLSRSEPTARPRATATPAPGELAAPEEPAAGGAEEPEEPEEPTVPLDTDEVEAPLAGEAPAASPPAAVEPAAAPPTPSGVRPSVFDPY